MRTGKKQYGNVSEHREDGRVLRANIVKTGSFNLRRLQLQERRTSGKKKQALIKKTGIRTPVSTDLLRRRIEKK